MADTVYDKIRDNRFQWSRHSQMLTPDEQSAYRLAGGGVAGRRAVISLQDGERPAHDLLRAYWVARYRFEESHGLPDVDHDPDAVDGSPQMVAWSEGYDRLRADVLEAAEAFKAATGEPIVSPPTPAVASEWRDEALLADA